MSMLEQPHHILEESLLHAAREVCARLREGGHRAYYVGGCVRDRMLGFAVEDMDIATDARPEQVLALFDDARMVGASFGVALVRHRGFSFEIATFRKDGRYLDFRHPDSVTFGSMKDDARRRDFTINALYQDPVTEEVIDLVEGRADFRAKLVRCVGDPHERFREDALRLLRAVRLATRIEFRIEEHTAAALRESATLLQYISGERVRTEVTRMLTGPHPGRAISMLEELQLLEWILPEVAALRAIQQSAEFHPEGDALAHTIRVVNVAQPRTEIVMWAVLLHDIGKVPTWHRGEDGSVSFHDHQRVGARMAGEVLRRMRFSAEDTSHITTAMSRHMSFGQFEDMRESTRRRFLASPTIETDLALHRADVLGSTGDLRYYDAVRAALAHLGEREEPAVPKPFVSGDDLQAMGLPPGPELGRILHELHDRQLEGEFSDREAALAAATRAIQEAEKSGGG